MAFLVSGQWVVSRRLHARIEVAETLALLQDKWQVVEMPLDRRVHSIDAAQGSTLAVTVDHRQIVHAWGQSRGHHCRYGGGINVAGIGQRGVAQHNYNFRSERVAGDDDRRTDIGRTGTGLHP